MQYQLYDRDVLLRQPGWDDGLEIYNLIKRSPPLDLNSVYSYHLFARHFAETCAVAEFQGEIVGFLSAYIEPIKPDTLFVWQVAVDEKLRGKRMAGTMISSLLSRPVCADVRYIEATVTPDNIASRKVFMHLGESLGGAFNEEPFLEAKQLSTGEQEHDPEVLLRVGPFDNVVTGNDNSEEKTYAHI